MSEPQGCNILLADDDVMVVHNLGMYMRDVATPLITHRWCEDLGELYEELRHLEGRHCLVVLDSWIPMGKTRAAIEDALLKTGTVSSSEELLSERALNGLLFASVIRELAPDAWIILHSAYAEYINKWRGEHADLSAWAEKAIDLWLWKPADWSQCVAAIRQGLQKWGMDDSAFQKDGSQ